MTNRDRVLSFVKNNPGCTQQEISKALGIRQPQVNSLLRTLIAKGVVYREEQKRPYRYYPRSVSGHPHVELQHPQGEEEDILKNITKDNMLIVVSCSEQKVWSKENSRPVYVPAIYAYTGNDVTWLKNNVPNGKGFHCLILSAKYGFIEPEHPIHYYDVTFSNPKTGPISIESLKNQVLHQSRLFAENERKLCEFKYVLVRESGEGEGKYFNNCQEAFPPTTLVRKLTDPLWTEIAEKIGEEHDQRGT